MLPQKGCRLRAAAVCLSTVLLLLLATPARLWPRRPASSPNATARLAAPSQAHDIHEEWLGPDHLRLRLPGRCEEVHLIPFAAVGPTPPKSPWYRRTLRRVGGP